MDNDTNDDELADAAAAMFLHMVMPNKRKKRKEKKWSRNLLIRR